MQDELERLPFRLPLHLLLHSPSPATLLHSPSPGAPLYSPSPGGFEIVPALVRASRPEDGAWERWDGAGERISSSAR
jgi:hypothetical protein